MSARTSAPFAAAKPLTVQFKTPGIVPLILGVQLRWSQKDTKTLILKRSKRSKQKLKEPKKDLESHETIFEQATTYPYKRERSKKDHKTRLKKPDEA